MERSEIKALLDRLSAYRGTGYGLRPLLTDIDEDFVKLFNAVRSSAPEQTVPWIRSRLEASHFFFFLAFAERMANWAVRTKKPAVLQHALIAISLVEGLGDSREIILILSLIYDAAIRIHADPRVVFTSVDEYCGPAMKKLLTDYINRDEHSIEAMGYVHETANGGTYKRTW